MLWDFLGSKEILQGGEQITHVYCTVCILDAELVEFYTKFFHIILLELKQIVPSLYWLPEKNEWSNEFNWLAMNIKLIFVKVIEPFWISTVNYCHLNWNSLKRWLFMQQPQHYSCTALPWVLNRGPKALKELQLKVKSFKTAAISALVVNHSPHSPWHVFIQELNSRILPSMFFAGLYASFFTIILMRFMHWTMKRSKVTPSPTGVNT